MYPQNHPYSKIRVGGTLPYFEENQMKLAVK